MNELRQNVLSGGWVIVAPNRGARPSDHASHRGEANLHEAERPKDHDEECPFCPGNEHMIPPILFEYASHGGEAWATRVVENKYPALVPSAVTEEGDDALYPRKANRGHHEVIIEHPLHSRTLFTMSDDEVHRIIETYRRRFSELQRENEQSTIMIFRNHGRTAGTSLMHPHSQLIVMPFMPPRIAEMAAQTTDYHNREGGCLLCTMAGTESTLGTRLIMETGHHLAFVPFAAEVPFEQWIVPKRHQYSFSCMDNEESRDLSVVLRESIARMHRVLGDPDYNYFLLSFPNIGTSRDSAHWYLQLRPRTTTPAGFELGAGISINSSLPERDARILRDPP
jgi:UDPglucose--hexose-1-phosphate uridylyltransferase